jgi:hypothetical protein
MGLNEMKDIRTLIIVWDVHKWMCNKLCRCKERLEIKEIQSLLHIGFQKSHDWLSIVFEL